MRYTSAWERLKRGREAELKAAEKSYYLALMAGCPELTNDELHTEAQRLALKNRDAAYYG